MISLTLKNYKRPNGVASQINNVDLSGYVNIKTSDANYMVQPDSKTKKQLNEKDGIEFDEHVLNGNNCSKVD